MNQKTINAIITRYSNYRDNDRILDLFTREGVISASSRGCRRPKSPLLGASELFVYGEFVLFEMKERYYVDSCEVQESFYPLREDIDRFAAASYMLALVNKSTFANENCAEAFELLYYALSYTAYTDVIPVDMALCFAAKYLSVIGYRPSITTCSRCGKDLRQSEALRFSRSGGASCAECSNGSPISRLSLEALRRMLRLDPQDMEKVVLPPRVRAELKSSLNEYAEYVLECELKPIDSL